MNDNIDDILRLDAEALPAPWTVEGAGGIRANDALRAENDRLRGVFEIAANALIQADRAEEEDLPCKANSWREGAKRALGDFAPSGEQFSELASKIRATMYRDQMLRAKDDEIEKLHGTIARLRSDSDRLYALLPKAFDAGIAARDVRGQALLGGFDDMDIWLEHDRKLWVANALKELAH